MCFIFVTDSDNDTKIRPGLICKYAGSDNADIFMKRTIVVKF
jgi:hypothetical protein